MKGVLFKMKEIAHFEVHISRERINAHRKIKRDYSRVQLKRQEYLQKNFKGKQN